MIIVNRFGELIRKIWNPRNFKAHVSPHEMLQVCYFSILFNINIDVGLMLNTRVRLMFRSLLIFAFVLIFFFFFSSFP